MEISVYDNGVGIEEAIRPKLFDMFFTGHEKAKGNGLGLYAVHKSVTALYGKIHVESEVGHYSRISVLHPIIPRRFLKLIVSSQYLSVVLLSA